MTTVGSLLVWIPLAFALFVAASYVGTTLALRAYFDDDEPVAPSEFAKRFRNDRR